MIGLESVGSNSFHHDRLAISKCRHGSSASQSLSLQDRWQGVSDQTKTCDNEISQAHGAPPSPLRFCLAEESRPHEPFLLQGQLAHRVHEKGGDGMTPQAPQSGVAHVNGTELYYEVAGTGHPFTLIHGLLLDRRCWDDQFEVFAQQYHVLRYDLRG
jgi:hypothetical protein